MKTSPFAPMLSSLLVLSLAVLSGPAALASVSLQNGNFFIGYQDISYPGGYEPKVERYYNSKSGYKGMFGWGWGTSFEVSLGVSADGSVVVREFGGGAENRFYPKKVSTKSINEAIDKIVEAAKSTGSVGKLSDYKAKLANDASYRNSEWEKFIRLKKLKPIVLPANTQLISHRYSYQFITKMKDGYVRKFDSGKKEFFNEEGQLIKVVNKDDQWIQLIYNKSGQLVKIVDNQRREFVFGYNSQGLLAKIVGSGKAVEYKYNNRQELIYAKDSAGDVFEYDYSNDGRHNMTQIKYADKSTYDIEYYPRKQLESVRKVKDRDGTVTEYTYTRKPDDLNFSVALEVKDSKGKKVSSSKYAYYQKIKKTGERWTQKMVQTVNGESTSTEYSECCGLPEVIRRGKDVTRFKYDVKGRVIYKDTPTEVTQLKYDNSCGKVTKVDRDSKLSKRKDWSSFDYDKTCNLKQARNSERKLVRLYYDRQGRIARMVDQAKRTITFEYDENSKPIEIKDPKLGAIRVSYKKNGEVQRVESPSGRRIALQVTSAFQNLLDIIRPAGVSLSF